MLPPELGGCYPPSLSVTPELFEAHASWLARCCSVVTVSQALALAAAGRADRRRPTVCITFDDGYADNAETAAPILDRHNLVGTFFVVTGFVGGGGTLWYDRAAAHWRRTGPAACLEALGVRPRDGAPASEHGWLEHLKRQTPERRGEILRVLDRWGDPTQGSDLYRPMTIDQVRRLREGGHEIGSHTETHPLLPQLSDADLANELAGSRRRLDEWLGAAPMGLCYPNGDFDDRVERAAVAAGYGYACTTIPGLNTARSRVTALRRRHIQAPAVTASDGRPSDLALSCEVWGVHDLWRRGR